MIQPWWLGGLGRKLSHSVDRCVWAMVDQIALEYGELIVQISFRGDCSYLNSRTPGSVTAVYNTCHGKGQSPGKLAWVVGTSLFTVDTI